MIELPGYKKIRNAYVKEDGKIEVITLGRYKKSKDMVVETIQEYCRNPIKAIGTTIEGILEQLPEYAIKGIIKGDEDAINFLKYCIDDAPEDEHEYVGINYACGSEGEMVEQIREKFDRIIKYNPEFVFIIEKDKFLKEAMDRLSIYESAGIGDLEVEGDIEIMLSNGSLPDKREIDILLKHGVERSETLTIRRLPLETAKNVIDSVYAGINAENIEELPDVTETILYRSAIFSMDTLLKRIGSKRITIIELPFNLGTLH